MQTLLRPRETKKHGVHIIEHKNWNSKQIWNHGYLMTTYWHVPKRIRFRSPMVNDMNQDLCGGWAPLYQTKGPVDRVLDWKKPMGIEGFWEDEKKEADALFKKLKSVRSVDIRRKTRHLDKSTVYDVIVANKGKLKDLFDLDVLSDDYSNYAFYDFPEISKQMKTYKNYRLIDFAQGWDIEDVPPWVTGLILGYPIENTISRFYV